jgi:SAM-dependent methyltransferase
VSASGGRAIDAQAVLWHDLECGSYGDDLQLWRELAAGSRGPVLDVGAGTGRVTLDLARRGHAVVALDLEPELLAALRDRAAGLPVETVEGDARDYALGRRFALILVPMQTVQLLGGPAGRNGFLRSAREHLEAGGTLAIALADALDAFDAEHDQPPVPDMREVDGIVYASRPVAVRDEGDRAAIHRIREIVDRHGDRTVEEDVIHLDRLDAATLEAEAAQHGLRAQPCRQIPPSDDYVGSTVVVLRG